MTQKQKYVREIEAHLSANRLMSARAACGAAERAGRTNEAISELRAQVEERIGHARKDAYEKAFNHAVGLAQGGDLQAAARAYRDAIAILPERPEAYVNLATQLQLAGDIDGAIRSCRAGLDHAPGYAPLHYNLAVILEKKGEARAAIAAYRDAVAASPDWAEAWYNLGAAHQARDELEDAVAAYDKALVAKPDYADAANNKGNALRDLGRFDEAVAAFDRALELNPAHSTARFNRALAYLSLGDFKNGWADYATRFDDAGIRAIAGYRDYGLPRWRGEKIAGKTLLVLGEQGAGDTLQFARFLPMLKKYRARVILECAAGLVPLMEGFPGVDGVRARPREETLTKPADLHVQLLDLPLIFGTRGRSIPADIPYIEPDPERLARWAQTLGEGGFQIGLVWSGNPRNRVNRRRAMPLAALSALTSIPGVRLFSLQKGPAAAELAGVGFAVEDLGKELGDYAETAAAIANLDLVVSVCTSVAHLAGAMGANCWTLLHKVPDWRWLPRADTSAWYPGMRLFYQDEAGDWRGVVEKVVAALGEKTG